MSTLDNILIVPLDVNGAAIMTKYFSNKHSEHMIKRRYHYILEFDPGPTYYIVQPEHNFRHRTIGMRVDLVIIDDRIIQTPSYREILVECICLSNNNVIFLNIDKLMGVERNEFTDQTSKL